MASVTPLRPVLRSNSLPPPLSNTAALSQTLSTPTVCATKEEGVKSPSTAFSSAQNKNGPAAR